MRRLRSCIKKIVTLQIKQCDKEAEKGKIGKDLKRLQNESFFFSLNSKNYSFLLAKNIFTVFFDITSAKTWR